jgi:sigma-B regulation protein RsbU (phosphoserine phosphatase)
MRILVAEDERITRRSLERKLVAWGHEVASAEDGQQACDRFGEGFEIVLTDWEMPNVDGPELVRRIRTDEGPGYVYVIMLTGRATKEDLVEGMEAGADDFLTKPFDDSELRVRLRAGERIIELERTLADQNSLLQAANDRMNRDLEAAARIQQSIMPEEPPELPAVACRWRYCPCDALAGDALNVSALDDRYLCSYVLDVSGHGVPAALLSVAVARSLWFSGDPTSLILAPEASDGAFGPFADPATVATRLNQRFPFEANGRRFFTMIYSLLDMQTGRLAFCCAGHPGPLRHARDGSLELIEISSHLVGLVDDPEYENTTIDLAPGDRTYFFSDGIPEQASPTGELYGTERFAAVLRDARGAPLQSSIDTAVDELMAWAGQDDFDDDVSLFGMEWNTP